MFESLFRIITATFVVVAMFISLGMCFSKPSFAAISLVERSDDELLILEMHVNDIIRDQALIAYLPSLSTPNDILLPLGNISNLLSFAVKVDPAQGIAEGWFLDESNIFYLDLNQNIVFVNGAEQSLPEGAAEAHFEDIYVQVDMMEQWFGLDINSDISTLRLFMRSSVPLPYEEELERKERAKEMAERLKTATPEYSNNVLLPYKWLSLPSAIFQQSFLFNRDPDVNRMSGSFSLQANGDVVGFGTRFLLSGNADSQSDNEITDAQLTFQRRDPGKNLLGPLRAGTVSLGDVDFPDVPLNLGRKRGRGISVSSDSKIGILRALGPEEFAIDGDAPIGWDAELYRNGFFVGFQEIGSDGRYSFDDAELIRGFNLFEIKLYGPEGQIRTETRRVVRGQEILRKGETTYEFAMGQPEADFLPIEKDRNKNSDFGTSGQIFYGVRENLTIGASVFSGADSSTQVSDKQNTATLSAVTAFLGFKTQLQLMKADKERSAYNIETSTRFYGANLTAGHTAYDGYDTVDKDLQKRTTIDVNKNFGWFSTSLRAQKIEYLNKDTEIILGNTFSTKILGVELTNSIEKIRSDNTAQEKFNGELTAAVNAWDWRIRSNFLYDLDSRAQDKLQSVRVSALRKLDHDSTIRLNGLHEFSTERTSLDARYSQQFDKFSMDVNFGATTDENYFAGVTVRTALQPDHQGKYNFINVRNGGLGSVGLRAFVDINENGQYDDGETLLKNIRFRSNRGLVDGETGENGTLFVNGLSESITRFSLKEGSLPSIYLKPSDDFVDIIPRIGATATIDFSFTQLGEIDGFIYAFESDENGNPKVAPGIQVRLIDADTGEEVEITSSEYDGYYVFSALPLGSYIVQALPIWEEDEQSMPRYNVSLTNEENMQTDINLILSAPIYSSEMSDF